MMNLQSMLKKNLDFLGCFRGLRKFVLRIQAVWFTFLLSFWNPLGASSCPKISFLNLKLALALNLNLPTVQPLSILDLQVINGGTWSNSAIKSHKKQYQYSKPFIQPDKLCLFLTAHQPMVLIQRMHFEFSPWIWNPGASKPFCAIQSSQQPIPSFPPTYTANDKQWHTINLTQIQILPESKKEFRISWRSKDCGHITHTWFTAQVSLSWSYNARDVQHQTSKKMR